MRTERLTIRPVRGSAACAAWLVLAAASSSRGAAEAPLGSGPAGIDGLALVPVGGVTARLDRVPDADSATPALRLSFTKRVEHRRFVAVESTRVTPVPEARALAMRCRVSLAKGGAPRAAVLLYEKGGGAWFKVASQPVAMSEFGAGGAAAGGFVEERVPLVSLREAGFSADASGKLEWENVCKVWAGLVIDGPAEGTFEVSSARFTAEAARPTRPLRATGSGPGAWRVSKDPAVRATLTTPDEGPGDRPCMKLEFTFPGGRHMYAVPTTPAPDADLEGYRALRFTYRAELPPGIKGLLVMLIEKDGAQYVAHPAPPATAEWKRVTIPFERFRLGSWTRDANGRLDLDGIASVAIACHGTSSGAGGDGVIGAADVEFVP